MLVSSIQHSDSVYICIYTYMYIHVDTYTHTHTHIYIHTPILFSDPFPL